VATRFKIGVDSFFECAEAQLFEAVSFYSESLDILQVGKRRSPPERECLRELPSCRKLLEAGEVEALPGQSQGVTGSTPFDGLIPERLPNRSGLSCRRSVAGPATRACRR
jgi:hypothetical protein